MRKARGAQKSAFPEANIGVLHRGAAPLHTQIATILRNRIYSGTFPQGSLLPSEEKLAQMYGVSRPVVRQAMLVLVQEGLIDRTAGRGTHVLTASPSHFLGWSIKSLEDLVSFAHATRFVPFPMEILPADDVVAGHLRITEGTLVAAMRGIRYMNDVCIAYQERFLLTDIAKLIENVDISTDLLSTIENYGKLEINRVIQAVTAVAAHGEFQRYLDLEEGAPALKVERLLISRERGPVLFSDIKYRPDRYRLISELNRLP